MFGQITTKNTSVITEAESVRNSVEAAFNTLARGLTKILPSATGVANRLTTQLSVSPTTMQQVADMETQKRLTFITNVNSKLETIYNLAMNNVPVSTATVIPQLTKTE